MNPPTQEREALRELVRFKDAVGTALIVLQGWEDPHASHTEAKRILSNALADHRLSAAYPQQTEGDEREWVFEASSYGRSSDGPLRHQGSLIGPELERKRVGGWLPIALVPKASLTAAEQERDWARAGTAGRQAYIVQLEADKDRLQIERNMAWTDRDTAKKSAEASLNERNRLQRELQQQTESLTEIAQREHERAEGLQRENERLRSACELIEKTAASGDAPLLLGNIERIARKALDSTAGEKAPPAPAPAGLAHHEKGPQP